MRLRRLVSLGLVVLFFGVTSAQAEVRALLIGVSDYEDETGISDLKGPKNDVMLMQSVLGKRGVDDIVIVADGIDGAPRPTLSAIESAFAEITARAQEDDLVYVHMSGHGTRQHDLGGDETDGLDEVFLPADVTSAGQGGKVIPNALTDDRIGQLIMAIREKGANVWLVMDSCHSGSGMRNLTSLTADRHVDPETLGISTRVAAPATAPVANDPPRASKDLGSYLAFYATRSNDVAREGDLSKGDETGAWYGLFSSAIAARLDSGQELSYRQLFQAVLSDLNRGSGFGAAAIQTPLWEGDLIDTRVFGGKLPIGQRRFLMTRDEVEAGLVHGLQEGTLLALMADISDTPDEVLGYAQVEEAQARRAYIRPVDPGCIPKSDALCAYAGSLPPDARFAQVELQPADLAIRFSPLIDTTTGAPLSDSDPLTIAFETAVASAAELIGIPAQISDVDYQVIGTLRGDSLWFGAVTAIGDAPAGLEIKAIREMTARDLAGRLTRILRAEQLAQTLERLGGESSFANPNPVKIEAGRFASELSQLTRPGERINPRRECGPVYQAAMASEFSPIEPTDEMKQCDVLRFTAQGTGDRQIDVNRIYIDAQYCIHADYELIEGQGARRNLGDELVICSDCPGDVPYSAGLERMYLLVSEQEENSEALNLSGLVENCVGAASVEGSRSARSDTLGGLLEQVVQAGGTRGNMGLSMSSATSGVWLESYRWEVVPRAEVFKRAQ